MAWLLGALGHGIQLRRCGATAHTDPHLRSENPTLGPTAQSRRQVAWPRGGMDAGLFREVRWGSSRDRCCLPFPPVTCHLDVALPWAQSPSRDLGQTLAKSLLGEAKNTIKKFNLQTHG